MNQGRTQGEPPARAIGRRQFLTGAAAAAAALAVGCSSDSEGAARTTSGSSTTTAAVPSTSSVPDLVIAAPRIVGQYVRQMSGEKIHEEMITASDSPNTVDLGAYYAILPSGAEYRVDDYCQRTGARRVAPGFSYDSGSNNDFLSVPQLRELIATHVEHKGQATAGPASSRHH